MENRRFVFFLAELVLEPLWGFKHRSTQVPKSVFRLFKAFYIGIKIEMSGLTQSGPSLR